MDLRLDGKEWEELRVEDAHLKRPRGDRVEQPTVAIRGDGRRRNYNRALVNEKAVGHGPAHPHCVAPSRRPERREYHSGLSSPAGLSWEARQQIVGVGS